MTGWRCGRSHLYLLSGLVLALAALRPAAADGAAQTGWVEVPGGKLWYDEMGEGAALVLVHDGLLHSVSWDGQVAAFARRFRTIRYDRRGYGRSETATRDFSAVDDLLAVLDGLKVERAVLVGCSSGGGLAVDFALAHPERVAGLVLEGAVISGIDSSAHFVRRNLGNFRPFFAAKDVAGTIDAWVNDPYLTDPHSTAARRTLREVLTAHPHQVDGSLPEGRQAARPAAGRLREIHVPTLVLTGAGDIPDVQAQAGVLAAGIVNARRVVLAGVGHLAHLEQPEELNRMVLAFLRPEDEAAEYLAALRHGAAVAGSAGVAEGAGFDYTAARRLFDYDAGAPLDVRVARTEERRNATVEDLSYLSPLGGRVPAYLVLPRAAAAAAKLPAVVFVHPGQGDRGTFLDEAVELAGRGVVCLLLGAPQTRPEHPQGGAPFDGEQDRRDFVQTAVDVRRGFDLLAARPEVDAAQFGYVGHSLGATIGGPLLAAEPRVRAWVLMAGFAAQTREWAQGTSTSGVVFRTLLPAAAQERYLAALAPIDTVRFLPHAPRVPVLLQFARRDEYIAPWDAALWMQATPGPAEAIWYDTGHAFDADARRDRDAWLVRQLGLGRPPDGGGLFELRNGFWVNLHQRLHAIAHGSDDPAAATEGKAVTAAGGGALSAAEMQAWEAAVTLYRRSYGRRDLLFDDGMGRINGALSAAGNAATLPAPAPTPATVLPAPAAALASSPPAPDSALPADLRAALTAAAPVYRAHWWPDDEAANRAWIDAVRPRLARWGPAIAARVTRALRVEWPSTPVVVDVAVAAGPFGAYTRDDPFTHVTVSSRDARSAGDASLEILFHEASHGWDQELIDGVAKAAADRGRPVPENLWHAVLFYTAGEATREALAAAAPPDAGAAYVPYAVRTGVYERGWQDYRKALEAAWQPYLEGRTDFAAALHAVIDALPPPGGRPGGTGSP